MKKYQDLRKRTKDFAIEVIKFVEALPRTRTTEIIANQLIRSSTSVAANYRAASKPKSQADYISKIALVEEESDESKFWLELLLELIHDKTEKCNILMIEASELTAIFSASGQTAKRNKAKKDEERKSARKKKSEQKKISAN